MISGGSLGVVAAYTGMPEAQTGAQGYFSCCAEIRRTGARLQEEAVQVLCRELLQPQAGSAQSSLVLNTLPWERTEVICRTGPDGRDTLGMSNSRVTGASQRLPGAEASGKEQLCLSLLWGGFSDLSNRSL